jgi:hypothetical protein
MATSDGKMCATETTIRVAGKSRVLNCQQFCLENVQQWIPSLFFKIPNSVQWINPETKQSHECDIQRIDITFLGKKGARMDDDFRFYWTKAEGEWKVNYIIDNISGNKLGTDQGDNKKLTPQLLKHFQVWIQYFLDNRKPVEMTYEIQTVPIMHGVAPINPRRGWGKDDVQVRFGNKHFLPFEDHAKRMKKYDSIGWYWMVGFGRNNTIELSMNKTFDLKLGPHSNQQEEDVAQGGSDESITKKLNRFNNNGVKWQTGKRGGRYYVDLNSGRKIYKRK